MRTVVDHHVDRPGVEAQQCVQLTGTNRSIGLNVLMTHAHQGWLFQVEWPRSSTRRKSSLLPLSFAGLVVVARSKEPDPIPNSAVKLLSADGTMSQDLGE